MYIISFDPYHNCMMDSFSVLVWVFRQGLTMYSRLPSADCVSRFLAKIPNCLAEGYSEA